MTKIIVKNNTTDTTYIYDRKDILKARIAVDYLSLNTPYLWYLTIVTE